MQYLLRYTKHAIADLAALDERVMRRIVAKIEYFAATSNPMRYAKALTGGLDGRYRFRIGDYRVVFRQTKEGLVTILHVVHVGHRSDVYGKSIGD